MRALQLAIERFQERWGTEPKFRAAWSTIGSAVTLIALCSCMYLVSRVGSSLIFGGGNATNANALQGPLQKSNPTFPVPTIGAGSGAPPTGGNPVASSSAPTPTPPVPPTPLSATPPVSPTAGVGATQPQFTATQGGIWAAKQNNAQLVNLTSTPLLPNAPITIDIDFGGGCKLTPALAQTLDDKGKIDSVSFTVPACAKAGTATVTISSAGFAPYTIPTPFVVK